MSNDTPMPTSMRIARLRELFQGNEDAVQLMVMLRAISHTWDDLIDRDKGVAAASVHAAFWSAIVGLQRNPFYRQFQEQLLPVLECGILNFIASCRLEQTAGRPRELAHTARYQVADVALVIARIVGGLEWAMVVGPELKLSMHDECFADFDKEMEVRYARDR